MKRKTNRKYLKEELVSGTVAAYNALIMEKLFDAICEEDLKDSILFGWTGNEEYIPGRKRLLDSFERMYQLADQLIISDKQHKELRTLIDGYRMEFLETTDRSTWRNIADADRFGVMNDWDRMQYNKKLRNEADIDNDVEGYFALFMYSVFEGNPEAENYRFIAMDYRRKVDLHNTLLDRLIYTPQEYEKAYHAEVMRTRRNETKLE